MFHVPRNTDTTMQRNVITGNYQSVILRIKKNSLLSADLVQFSQIHIQDSAAVSEYSHSSNLKFARTKTDLLLGCNKAEDAEI